MLGFYAIADLPISGLPWDADVTTSSQSATLALNSVNTITGVNYTTPSQNLAFTQNAIIVEVQPPIFDSQSFSSALNSVTITITANALLGSQTLTLTPHSVSLSTDNVVPLDSQSMAITESSVAVETWVNALIGSLNLQLTQNSIGLELDAVLPVIGQTIYTTINGLRLWQDIDTDGDFCPWRQITFGEYLYGDDFAIASDPICGTPRPLPPILKTPPNWNEIATPATTVWTEVET